MGCCRPGSRRVADGASSSGPCKSVEQGGAGLKLLVATDGGVPMLLLRGTSPGDRYELLSYLTMHRCTGPTARSIRIHTDRVLQAMRKNIVPFRKYTNGASLVTLLKTADAVLKDTRSSQDARNRPFPSS